MKNTANILKNADSVRVLFKSPTLSDRTSCICDVAVTQHKEAGSKNLISHLQAHHSGYEKVAAECIEKACVPTSSMIARDGHS
ncbi:hypothetical protein JG687_00009639 [Phytophthora cactorum]|uniref:BED-type domain-containing protein n=1 Tax=Phytophthora cactorum TaxID=29920 RepID=A0A8T1UDC9_9STRA|nr:hypothetical protein JG687_00009639 [Phytophthora cactorum]